MFLGSGRLPIILGLFIIFSSNFVKAQNPVSGIPCDTCLGLDATRCQQTAGCFWSDRINTCGNTCEYQIDQDCCQLDALGNPLSGCCHICRWLGGGLSSCIIRWDFHFDICLVVDASESITLVEWQSIKEFFIVQYIDAITPSACDLANPDVSGFCPHVGIVQYDSIAQTIIPNLAAQQPYYNQTSSCFRSDTYLNHLHPGWQNIVSGMLRSQDQARPAGGNTWTVLGVQRCADLLVNTYLRQPKTLSLLVVMTDGSPNGPSRCAGDVCDICGVNPEKEDFQLPKNDFLHRFDASCDPAIAGQVIPAERPQLQKMLDINARRILVLFKPEVDAFKNDIKLRCMIANQPGTFSQPFEVPTRLLQNVSDLTIQGDVGSIIKTLADTVCEFSVAPTMSPTVGPTIQTSNPTLSPSLSPTTCIGVPSDYVRPDCQPQICGGNDEIVSVNPAPALTILNGDRTRMCWSFTLRNVFGNPNCLTNNDPVRGVSFMMDECCPDGVMNFVELVEMENEIGQIVSSASRAECPLRALTDPQADNLMCSRAVRKCAHTRRATQDCVVINLNNVFMGDVRGQFCLTVPGVQWKNNFNDELRPGVTKQSKICFERGDENDPINPTNVCSCFPVNFVDSEIMCQRSGLPTTSPTISPTLRPTVNPSLRPSLNPTLRPTANPTLKPTNNPTLRPTRDPTDRPTANPTLRPTQNPTLRPSVNPTRYPTVRPTISPSLRPTTNPTLKPTLNPTLRPTNRPTDMPSPAPTDAPTTCIGVPSDYVRPDCQPQICGGNDEIVSVNPAPALTILNGDRTRMCWSFTLRNVFGNPNCLTNNDPVRGVSFMMDECCPDGVMNFVELVEMENEIGQIVSSASRAECPLRALTDPQADNLMCSRAVRKCAHTRRATQDCVVINLNNVFMGDVRGQFCLTVPGVQWKNNFNDELRPGVTKQSKICFERGDENDPINPTNVCSCFPVNFVDSEIMCQKTGFPTVSPTNNPTLRPTIRPSNTPTRDPTMRPSLNPTLRPTLNPSLRPTGNPTLRPTLRPSLRPSQSPTLRPTLRPTFRPTLRPSLRPSPGPTMDPTQRPSRNPTVRPTFDPSASPTRDPTKRPTTRPTPNPTNRPSLPPTRRPTLRPTGRPSRNPTLRPTLRPTARPTGCQGPPPDYKRASCSASTFGMCNGQNGNVEVDTKPMIIVDDATQTTKFCYEFSIQTPLHQVCVPPQGTTTVRGISFMFDECCSSSDMEFLQEITLGDMSYNVRQGQCPIENGMMGMMKGCSRSQRLCSAAESSGDDCGIINLNGLSFTGSSSQFCFSVPGTNFNMRDPSRIDRRKREMGKICFENGVANTTENTCSCMEVEIPKSTKLCKLTPQPSPSPTPAPTECEGEYPPAFPPQTCEYPCAADELAEWDPYLYKYEYNEEHDVTYFKYCVDIDKYWFKEEHACIAPGAGFGGKGWAWKGKGPKPYPSENKAITIRLDTCCELCLTPQHFYEASADGIDITNRGKSPYFTIPEGYECYMLKFNGHVETRSGLACIEGGKKCACSEVPVPFSCDLKRFANPDCRSRLGGGKGWWRKRGGN